MMFFKKPFGIRLLKITIKYLSDNNDTCSKTIELIQLLQIQYYIFN